MNSLIKRASWLRRTFELWLMRQYMLRHGPQMIARRGYWWYVDPYGDVYALRPTGRHGDPLVISMVDRG